MAYISNEEITEIRKEANIVDIIGSYLTIEKKGKDYKCVCPFHDDHSPSMSISEEKQIYKCFSCGAAGNVFTFVQNYENVSFIEAVKIVADKIGHHLSKDISYHNENVSYQDEKKIMELTESFYQNNLITKEGIIAKKYLKERHITDEIINEFGIGLALDKNDSLANLLTAKGYDITKLEKMGLVNINGDKVYDVFQGRITFPLHDSKANLIGFSSRIYRNEKDIAKYINTKETYLYTKGNNLFNYFRASKEAKLKKQLIIVEGQMDAIRVYSSGIKNVVALMGTALTKKQIDLIKQLRCSVILCLDSDDAGSHATIVNGDLLNANNIKVLVVRLADYKDPDEYIINKGIKAFEDNINHPFDYIDFKVKALKNNLDLNNSEDLATYINEVIANISKEKDIILKEVTLNKLSEEYHIDLSILKAKLDSYKEEEKVANEIFSPPSKEEKLNGYDNASKKILGYFKEKKYRDIANEIVYYNEKNKDITMADFISYIENYHHDLLDIVNTIIINDEILDEEEFNNNILRLQKKNIKDEIKKLKEKMKEEMDLSKKVAIATRITELKKEEK